MKFTWFWVVLNVLKINGLFWNLKFGPRFNIADRELRIPIKTDQSDSKTLRGFYGLIGPDLVIRNKTTLFDLFIGDGVIQGAFFENGQITFIKHFIRTDKLKYESDNGRIPDNFFVRFIIMILSKLNLMPNILGLANTALLNVNKDVYALYERDMPYLLNVNFENKTVETVKKMHIKSMATFSAHSKFSNEHIETLDYSIIGNYVEYQQLNRSMGFVRRARIHTKYMPVVHDFLSINSSIIIADSPLIMNGSAIFENILPVSFDKKKPTFFHVIDRNDLTTNIYSTNESFYIFHYADGEETDGQIEFFAPLYENLDFNNLNIHGKYRKFILDKKSKTVVIEKSPVLETMNLDFPVRYGDKIVLRKIENNIITGFIIMKGLEIEKRIDCSNKFICGEPAIYKNILVFFANDLIIKRGYLVLLNLDTYERTEIVVQETELSVGFHSLFLPAH
jgi:hypothetical protein